MSYSDWMYHRMKAAEDKQNEEEEDKEMRLPDLMPWESRPEPDTGSPENRSMEDQYTWINGVRVPNRLVTTGEYGRGMGEHYRPEEDMESAAYIETTRRRELRIRGFSEPDIETLLSGLAVPATSSQAIVEPENYVVENKRPIITQRMIKNAIENKSLAASMDRMEEVIRDQIQKVVKEEFKGSEVIEEGPLMIDRVAEVSLIHSNTYYEDSVTGLRHKGHPACINSYIGEILDNGGEIISIQHIDMPSKIVAMIHYKAPREAVLYT